MVPEYAWPDVLDFNDGIGIVVADDDCPHNETVVPVAIASRAPSDILCRCPHHPRAPLMPTPMNS